MFRAHPTTSEERRENWLHLQQWEKKRLETSNLLYYQQGGEGELKKVERTIYAGTIFFKSNPHAKSVKENFYSLLQLYAK